MTHAPHAGPDPDDRRDDSRQGVPSRRRMAERADRPPPTRRPRACRCDGSEQPPDAGEAAWPNSHRTAPLPIHPPGTRRYLFRYTACARTHRNDLRPTIFRSSTGTQATSPDRPGNWRLRSHEDPHRRRPHRSRPRRRPALFRHGLRPNTPANPLWPRDVETTGSIGGRANTSVPFYGACPMSSAAEGNAKQQNFPSSNTARPRAGTGAEGSDDERDDAPARRVLRHDRCSGRRPRHAAFAPPAP